MRNRGRVASLFTDGRAATTLLIWAIGWLSTLASYLVLIWTPAVLHDAGAKPSQAAVATSLYAMGLIGGILTMAQIVDRFGMKRVLTFGLALGASALLPPDYLARLYGHYQRSFSSPALAAAAKQASTRFQVSSILHVCARPALGGLWAWRVSVR